MAQIDITKFAPARAEVDGQQLDVLIPKRPWYDALLAGEGDEPIHRWTLKVRQNLDSPTASADCWSWTGAIDRRGYGVFHLGGQKVLAHFVLWAVEHGSPPAWAYGPNGWERVDLGHVCHDQDASCAGGPSCIHRRCVNSDPGHLQLQLHSTNVRLGLSGAYQRRKTQCPSGHSYAEFGRSYTDPKGRTRRYCSACKSGQRAPEFVGSRKQLAVAA